MGRRWQRQQAGKLGPPIPHRFRQAGRQAGIATAAAQQPAAGPPQGRTSTRGLLKRRSVRAWRSTPYASGLSSWRHSASLCCTCKRGGRRVCCSKCGWGMGLIGRGAAGRRMQPPTRHVCSPRPAATRLRLPPPAPPSPLRYPPPGPPALRGGWCARRLRWRRLVLAQEAWQRRRRHRRRAAGGLCPPCGGR